MHVIVAGRKYRWLYTNQLETDCDGMCDHPSEPNKAIRVRESMDAKRRLEVEIHEMLHAADWTKDESWIDQTAKDLSAVLWRLGYRIND